MPDLPETFMEYVQFHERMWGNESYPERPALARILEAPVVVFWQDVGPENIQNRRFQVTLHDTLKDVEAHYNQFIQRTHNQIPEQRIHRIFKGQRRVLIKRIHIEFEEADSDPTVAHNRQADNDT